MIEVFIKYDEYDLLELFLKDPISITGDLDAGELIYMYNDSQNFKLILAMDVYRQTCSLSVSYYDSMVFTGDFNNVTSIIKIDNSMLIKVNDTEKLKVNFSDQIGLELL